MPIYFGTNTYWEPIKVELPPTHGKRWFRVIDTSLPDEEDIVTGDEAVFALTGAASLHGDAVCLPSATQCRGIKLKVGQSETLDTFDANGNPVTYELKLAAIAKHEVSASSARAHAATRAARTARSGRRPDASSEPHTEPRIVSSSYRGRSPTTWTRSNERGMASCAAHSPFCTKTTNASPWQAIEYWRCIKRARTPCKVCTGTWPPFV